MKLASRFSGEESGIMTMVVVFIALRRLNSRASGLEVALLKPDM